MINKPKLDRPWELIDTRTNEVLMNAPSKRDLQRKALRAGLVTCERSKYFLNWYVGHYDWKPIKILPWKPL